MSAIESVLVENRVFPPSDATVKAARISGMAASEAMCQEAERDFTQALKKNPRCAQAYFFQGQMHKLLGDGKKALAMFQKTLDLQADHVDAQREIRYLKK